MIVRNVLAALGFLTVAAVAAVSINAYGVFSDDPPPRLAVSFSGVDLTTPEGLDRLDSRISRAVDEICRTDATRGLSAKRLEDRCRANAWASVRPQVDRAIERARAERRTGYADNRSVLDDIARQPSGTRRSIQEALGRSFSTGTTANWYSWGGKGLVYAGATFVDRASICRRMSVTSKSHGVQSVIADGPVCRSPYGVLESPLPA